MVFAAHHLDIFVAGRKVTFYTVHQLFRKILGSAKQSPRMACWCVRQSAYDYDLK